MFMFEQAREICGRFGVLFDRLNQTVETFQAIDPVRFTEPCAIESAAQHGERFVVGLQWNRKRMAILSAERE